MAEATRRIIVHGRVQGVFYRGWTVAKANELGLAGWVRNRRDGTVEILARGEEEALDRLADACRGGPPAAQVERVNVEESAEDPGEGFNQRPTA